MKQPDQPKQAPRDLVAEFLAEGMEQGFSESQLRFLWKATERRGRPTGKLDRNDYAGLFGAALIIAGVALWSVPGAFVLAGVLIVAGAYLTAK